MVTWHFNDMADINVDVVLMWHFDDMANGDMTL
jgi:hypothetical protein